MHVPLEAWYLVVLSYPEHVDDVDCIREATILIERRTTQFQYLFDHKRFYPEQNAQLQLSVVTGNGLNDDLWSGS